LNLLSLIFLSKNKKKQIDKLYQSALSEITNQYPLLFNKSSLTCKGFAGFSTDG